MRATQIIQATQIRELLGNGDNAASHTNFWDSGNLYVINLNSLYTTRTPHELSGQCNPRELSTPCSLRKLSENTIEITQAMQPAQNRQEKTMGELPSSGEFRRTSRELGEPSREPQKVCEPRQSSEQHKYVN